jgi:hypothetical protein
VSLCHGLGRDKELSMVRCGLELASLQAWEWVLCVEWDLQGQRTRAAHKGSALLVVGAGAEGQAREDGLSAPRLGSRVEVKHVT